MKIVIRDCVRRAPTSPNPRFILCVRLYVCAEERESKLHEKQHPLEHTQQSVEASPSPLPPPTYNLIDNKMISNQLEIEILNCRSSAAVCPLNTKCVYKYTFEIGIVILPLPT